MKSVVILSLLISLFVREIYSITLCFTEKYNKYEEIFNKAYSSITGTESNLKYKYFGTMDEYFMALELHGCDIVMMEPVHYDKNYSILKNINKSINEIVEKNMKDSTDGNVYKDLIKDLQVNGRTEVNALPLFLDYGILYYRSDLIETTPKTWSDLYLIDTSKFKNSDTVYIGQFVDYIEFYYNLMEDVLNTKESISYDVVEKEANYTLGTFKKLFDNGIIDEFAWHLNSEIGLMRFNDGYGVVMRNWSSNLYNVTTVFKEKNKDKKFDISKTLYSEERFESSRAINKGIYLGISKSVDDKNIDEAVKVLKTFSSKEFMQLLLKEDIFYDLPAYRSLILEDDTIDNKDYCKKINCAFFRKLAKDDVIPTYSIFYRKNFLEGLTNFYDKAKEFFKDDKASEKEQISLMSEFKNDFESSSRPRAVISYCLLIVFILYSYLYIM